MSNQEILEQAIQKAQSNGWLDERDINHTDSMGWTMVARGKVKKSKLGLTAKVTYMISENDILYDKDFAKALWGGIPDVDDEGAETMADWQYHLQEMVTADDPIKYLGENI